jgi:REP element-mobilizing transposase RayT
MVSAMAMRSKPRRKRGQLVLDYFQDKNGQRRRGTGAGGRPAKDPTRPSQRHKVRPVLDRRHPQHVTLRVVGAVGYLRKWHYYRAVRLALFAVFDKTDFRIVHFSIQGNHLHLVCEAENRIALAQGLKSFQSSAAQRINRVASRRAGKRIRGTVFADRYHATSIKSVQHLRNVLSYVLNNFRHHELRGPTLFDGKIDAFSSALWFPGWKERTTSVLHAPPDYDAPPHVLPQTWLLGEGWKRARKPISVYEVPRGPGQGGHLRSTASS